MFAPGRGLKTQLLPRLIRQHIKGLSFRKPDPVRCPWSTATESTLALLVPQTRGQGAIGTVRHHHRVGPGPVHVITESLEAGWILRVNPLHRNRFVAFNLATSLAVEIHERIGHRGLDSTGSLHNHGSAPTRLQSCGHRGLNVVPTRWHQWPEPLTPLQSPQGVKRSTALVRENDSQILLA